MIIIIMTIIRTIRATMDMVQNVLEANEEVVYEIMDKQNEC
jgi:hypothetical protein